MQDQHTLDRQANLVGSLWMIAAMACFAIEDVFVKAAAVTLPIGQLLILFGTGGAIVFAAAAFLTKTPLLSADVVSRPMRIRVLFEVMGRLFYALAIALTPLSSATVILQATPIVVVASAALIFGEKVGPRRWIAIVVGLIGVLIIIQPGSDSFSTLSILAVLGMLGFAGRDLASRAAPKTLGTAALGFFGFLAVVAAGLIYSVYEGVSFATITLPTALHLCGASLVGAAAYAGLMKAMRTGEVSAVTPFRYSRLLFGGACGVFIFKESVSTNMLFGSALIVASGLIIMWRSKPR
ncbi:EamA-like transporter family protein [Yoonia maritima]|uniref:EamA-like transporter family protein n=1 Tax=Yoonia maritima TaxID=1435347 RepID=A0A2T0VUS8_9RHOB|nr:DMT family transporter [Yoonia maritima]PRY75212.1 EamA-like transporter family protein [Yoonia maritima]